MGNYYRCNCQNCGYEIMANYSSGDLTAELYERTVKRMKKGQLGKEAKAFFQEHPDGAVDVQPSLYVCSGCGAYKDMTVMDMYIPEDGYVHNSKFNPLLAKPTVDETVYPEELKAHYRLFKKYKHLCPECKAEMFIIPEKNILKLLIDENMTCPNCGDHLVLQDMFF